MKKLSDTHLIVLSKAAQRDDGAIDLPHHMTAELQTKVVHDLQKVHLIEEVPAIKDLVWRADEGGCWSLVITEAGLAAIGLSHEGDPLADDDAANPGEGVLPPTSDSGPGHVTPSSSLILTLVGQEKGASIATLMQETGWQAHSLRAAITGLRKRGHVILSSKAEDGQSRYRGVAPNEQIEVTA
jgi:hypothetical protein